LTINKEVEAQLKREKIQNYLWSIVRAEEHISLPKLKHAIKREFNSKDDRAVQAQIRLMQTENRIRIENKVKVWIKKPRF